MNKSHKTRILALVDNLDEHTGWGRYSWNIIKRLTKCADFDVRVLASRGSGKEIETVCLSKNMRPSNLFRTVLSVRRAAKSADIIHAFDGFPYGVLAYLGTIGMRNKRIIINGVGTYAVKPLLNPVKGWFLKRAYKKADSVLCISNYTLSRIKKHVPSLSNLSVVHLGVDGSKFNVEGFKKNKNDQPHLLVTGEIKSRKGQIFTVRAVNELKETYPGIKLTIVGYVGSKAYYEDILEFIENNDLKKHVEFLRGITDEELGEVYKKADIYVMPSLSREENFEGFGLVYIEAGLYGVPSIGSRGSGAEDAIVDGKTGYLIEQESVEDIVNAVKRIFSQDDYQALSKEAREFAQEFTWEKTVAGYIDAYEHTNSK